MHDGIAYVCLEAFKPFAQDLKCASLSGTAGERFCLGPNIILHVGPTCLATDRGDPALLVAFRDDRQKSSFDWDFRIANFPVRLGSVCATLALAPDKLTFETLEATLRGPDGTPIWQQEIPATAFVTTRLP
ncbi:hypothetical protein [Albidovulum sp.]|uniref:hypothetical protein n=1 Tax=Albidovulum sp. TaxID=1872424 RepID=UPI003D7DE490